MVSILIVDDEEIIRTGLKNSLPWEKLGIEVLGIASDGETALQIIKTQPPDLVLADIRMPKLDGLELAQKLKIVKPNTKMVLLTGYNDFEYAQQAIQLGVNDYLLKPVDAAKLIECLAKLRDRVLEERAEQLEKQAVQNYIMESRPFLKTWFFSSLENRDLAEENISKQLGFLHIDLDRGWLQALVVTMEEATSVIEEEHQYLTFNIFKNIEKLLTDTVGLKILPFFENMLFTIILSFPAGLKANELRKINFTTANVIKEFLEYNLNCSYTIGIGRPFRTLADLELSYHQAIEASKHRFYLGKNQIIFIDDVEPVQTSGHYWTIDAEELVSAIKVGNMHQAVQLVTDFLTYLKSRRLDMETVQRACLEVMIYISRALRELGEPPDFFTDANNPWQLVGKQTTIDQLSVLMLNTIKNAIAFLTDTRKNKNQKIVAKVQAIIAETYAQNISLESIAEIVSLSPCYLSLIFSQAMTVTFKEYLIQTRLEKAKNLLLNINLKIYEVAERVGYSDSRYFSQMFKKYTGLTPGQYRDHSG